jgi:hypothetical protein
MKGLLHVELLCAGFLHAGLLHVGGTVTPQEQTKGNNTVPAVLVHGTIATKITRAILPGPPLPPFGAPYIPRIQVDLGQLVGPLGGITSFTVARLVRTPATEEEGRGSPAVEPLTRGTMDLLITDRPATPYHRLDPPSPTPNETNSNYNGSGSDSPPRLSPLGNMIIRRVIRLPTSTRTRSATSHPSAFTGACPSDSMV